MKYFELVNNCNPNEVYKVFNLIYNDDKIYATENRIVEFIKQLKLLELAEEEEMVIAITKEDDYVVVNGVLDEERYGIEFTPWNRWLQMTISSETLNSYSSDEIIAHCIWEMTFFGWDETIIKKEIDKLVEQVTAIENGTAKTLSWEEVKSSILQSLKEKGEDTTELEDI